MTDTVLLIEDEPNITEAIRFLLARDGLLVECLDSGSQAMAAIRRLHPSLVILDLMLPGRSGIDILRDMRADPELETLPVIMLTAKGQTQDRDAATAAGASLFIAKPFSNTEIVAAVRSLLV